MPVYSVAALGPQLPEPHRQALGQACRPSSWAGMLCANPSQDLNQTLTNTTPGARTCRRLHIYPQKTSEPHQPAAVPQDTPVDSGSLVDGVDGAQREQMQAGSFQEQIPACSKWKILNTELCSKIKPRLSWTSKPQGFFRKVYYLLERLDMGVRDHLKHGGREIVLCVSAFNLNVVLYSFNQQF